MHRAPTTERTRVRMAASRNGLGRRAPRCPLTTRPSHGRGTGGEDPSPAGRGRGGEDPSPAGRGTGGEDLLKRGERFGLLLVLGALLLAGQRDGWPFRTWRRVSNGPGLGLRGVGWA